MEVGQILDSGAYLGGGMAPCPPLGRQYSIISIEKYGKLRQSPPPLFLTWAESLSAKTDKF